MIKVLIEIYLFIPLKVTLTTFLSQQCQTILTENFVLLPDQIETLHDCKYTD